MSSLGVLLVVHFLCLPVLGHTRGETCTNECGGNQATNWCGQRREGETGKVLRCAESTKGGSMLCMESCDYHGESYTWCRTGLHVPSQWDYCSSPGKVIQVMYTTYGQQCQGECSQQDKNYWWCFKSMRWEGKNADFNWGDCSMDDRHTRYNTACSDACASRGESYYWCHTQGTDWEYCSPPVTELEPQLTRDNKTCTGICARRAEEYYYCPVTGYGGALHFWDYCGPSRSPSTRTNAHSVSVLLLLFLINVI